MEGMEIWSKIKPVIPTVEHKKNLRIVLQIEMNKEIMLHMYFSKLCWHFSFCQSVVWHQSFWLFWNINPAMASLPS